jgi:hypothetical protein
MNMKTAQALVQELTSRVVPPLGVAIMVKEMSSNGPDDPNWVASAGPMDLIRAQRFGEKVAELRKSDLLIDWSGVEGQRGHRRVALWASDPK